jgi:hypothetical protein
MGIESDMVTNYRGIAALWLAFSLLGASSPACSESIRSGELGLAVESPWQRAGVDEEQSTDSIILRQPEANGVLEVYLPLHRVRLKTTTDAFFEQLDLGWKARYGDEVGLEWREIGGARWRVCRRLSLDSGSVIFQLVTVLGEEAYQVVAVVPPGTRNLPEPVLALLQHSSWGEPAPVVAAEPALPVKVPPVAAVSEPVKPAPLATPVPGKPWHLLRQVVVQPGQGQWEQISSAEKDHFGANGLVTGLGLKAEKNDLDWFLEEVAAPGGESGTAGQRRYQAHWRLKWSSPAEIWREGENQAMALTFADALDTAQPGNAFGVRYELLGVCAPRSVIVGWLDDLDSGRPDAMNRLGTLTSGCRPQPDGPSPVTVMAAKDAAAFVPRQPMNLNATLPLPMEWASAIQARDSGSVRRFMLIMHFMTSATGTSPGDALLKQATVIFVYGPDA